MRIYVCIVDGLVFLYPPFSLNMKREDVGQGQARTKKQSSSYRSRCVTPLLKFIFRLAGDCPCSLLRTVSYYLQ
jgi:hypothetical protein